MLARYEESAEARLAAEVAKRSEQLDQVSPLPYLTNLLLSIERLRIAAQTRLSHLRKYGVQDIYSTAVLNDLIGLEERLAKLVREEMERHPTWPWLERVKGAGLENSAKVVGIIEGVTFKSTGRRGIAAFDTMSRLRRFAGLAPIDGRAERKVKGQKLHYSPELRAMLWRLGGTLIQAKGKFYEYYIERKEEYAARFTRDGYSIMPTPKGGWRCANCGAEFERRRDVAGCCDGPLPERVVKKEPPGVIWLGHLDNMAKRKMITMFTDMLWRYWRSSLGLPCLPSYIVGKEPNQRQHEPEDFIG